MLRDFFKTESEKLLEDEVTGVLLEMGNVGSTSAEYPELLDKLERLEKVRSENRRKPINFDTVLTVLGNLAGVGLLVVIEQRHVIASTKAFSHLSKVK